MKKDKSKLNNDKIFKHFVKDQGRSKIVAYYIYNKHLSNDLMKELVDNKNMGEQTKSLNSKKEKKEKLEEIDLENELKEIQEN